MPGLGAAGRIGGGVLVAWLVFARAPAPRGRRLHPHRNVGQVRQQVLLDQVGVHRVVHRRDELHHGALELVVQVQAELHAHIKRASRFAQQPAQGMRADGQGLGIEGRASDDHAETLPEQEQGKAVADLGPHGDLVQCAAFVHRAVFHQGQHPWHGRRAFLVGILLRLVLDRGERRLQPHKETRGHVGAHALEFAQRVEGLLLHIVAARLFGQLEQVLLEFVQRDREATVEFVGDVVEHAFEQRAHPGAERRAVRAKDAGRCSPVWTGLAWFGFPVAIRLILCERRGLSQPLLRPCAKVKNS
jgi:hypothetical protein